MLLESPGFIDFLLSLSTLAATALGGKNARMCAITVERDGSPATVASSGPEAQRLDEIQLSLHKGPCLTALRTAQTIRVTDAGTDPRWTAYARAMSEENVRSVLAVPISTDAGSAAALNCYSSESGDFEPGTVEQVQEYAASISNILRLALRVHPAPPYPEHLRSALQSRAVIDAAVALVMAQNRCSHDQALALISRAATIKDTRMHDIAADIIAGAAPDAGPADRGGEDPTGR
ncbi:GAF and ANTAR domain-containing protein [Arthrobacter sp. NPDC056886]|uniref:GAF and ANTAR domain-containing protein n=1 Tax=Arthrobacter sp. NPDC056886 TaxID=3345960 RepID=UPI00366D9E22